LAQQPKSTQKEGVAWRAAALRLDVARERAKAALLRRAAQHLLEAEEKEHPNLKANRHLHHHQPHQRILPAYL